MATSPQFEQTVAKTFNQLPPQVKQKLLAANVEIKTGVLLTDAMPDLTSSPDGWPEGTTWDEVGAVHRRSNESSVIGISEFLRSDDLIVRNKRVAGALRHELGHVWDFLMEPNWGLSRGRDFGSGYQEDLIRMGPLDRIYLRSFLQFGQTGTRETFAEAFAVLVGGGSGVSMNRDILFRGAFPNSMRVVADSLEVDLR